MLWMVVNRTEVLCCRVERHRAGTKLSIRGCVTILLGRSMRHITNLMISVPPLPGPGDPPGVLVLLVLVVERLDALVLLEVGQLGRVRHLEERRRELHQPLGVDGRHLNEKWLKP